MRILLVQSTVYVPTHGGENKANRLLVEGLTQTGHSCRVVAPACGAQGPGTRAQFLDELTSRGLSIASSSSGADVFYQNGVEVRAVTDAAHLRLHLVDEIREFEPTWVLVSSEDPGQVLLEAALAASPSRVVYVAHTMLFFPFGPHCFLPDQRKTELFKKLAGIITVSNYLKEYIRQWSGCDSAVIPFPVYGPGPFPHFGSFDAGSVMMINPCAYKGISIFLELARRMPDVQFAAVPSWGTTQADRVALERFPNVRLLKATDGIDDLFAQTRVLLVPSLWAEGFPLVPVEAMLRGIPVVASNSTGLPESKLGVDYVLPVRTIEHYQHLFDDQKLPIPIIPEQDVGPWEETLRRLLSDRAHYEQLSAASRDAALSFNSGLSVAPFEDFLENLTPPLQAEQRVTLTQNREQNSSDDAVLEEVDRLSLERRALLALRLKKKGRDVPREKKRIPQRKHSDTIPLSFSQQRLWFVDQLDPANPAYNMAWGFYLSGPLNGSILGESLNEIVRRHEILRTTFASVNGSPVQVIAPSLKITLPIAELDRLSASERETEVLRLATEEARLPFSLVQGPLLRAQLLHLGEDEHMLLLTLHHIIYDLWSMGVLFSELGTLYESYAAGKPSPLPELPIQFADYAEWQRAWLQGEVYDKQLAYWKDQLQGAPAVLDLPTDRLRPAVQNFDGSHLSIMLPKRLSDDLRELSQCEGITLFMTLLAAFQTLLMRYTNQEEIVVGSPIAGRTRPEVRDLIGFFVNNLVIRTDMSGDPTFRELLARVREVTLGAYAHQDLPFEKLVEELHPERSLSHTPLFQAMFALQNALTQIPELPGLKLSQLQVDHGTSKFDLTLYMVEEAEGLHGRLEYKTDLFDAVTIQRMLGHFQTLLEGIIANPDEHIAKLPLLTEAEREQLLVEWNSTQTDFPKDLCLHEQFERQVERNPDSTAVLFEDKFLTYRQLNARANQLAHYLRRMGVGPDVPVGILMERSLEMAVGMMGTLKAGAAYVPLDSTYPKERLAFMLEDAQVPVLLTQKHLEVALPGFEESGPSVVCLDGDWPTIAEESEKNPVSGATPRNLVYVIFTSGSTGKPKGVILDHRGRVNNFYDFNKRFSVGVGDRVLAISSLSFDMCAYDVLGTLAAGAAIVMPEAARMQDPTHWADLIVRHQVTIWHSVPAMLEMLVEYVRNLPELHPHSIRLVLLGGDWIPVTLPDRIKAIAAEGVTVISLGGATEVSMDSTIYAIEASDPNWKSIPYGKPMANQLAYVLDKQLQPLPIGVPGELHLGGVGVGRGYFNRPELTAEKFITNPFSHEQDARLYKTGDLARFRLDGNLELLGRMDFQVKIRGFRIELGEIAAALRQHKAVQEAIVMAREDGPGNKRLVAYVVAHQGASITTTELRNFLKDSLPEYMTPSAFVMLEALPLTPNGKIDRRALPAPDQTRPELEKEFVAPRSPVEEVMAGIWSEVLRIEEVGVHDNFFELGGHSLLATQVIARLQDAFTVEIPLRSIFESPTVAGLSECTHATGRAREVDVFSIAQLIVQLNQLSEEDVSRMLAERTYRQQLETGE